MTNEIIKKLDNIIILALNELMKKNDISNLKTIKDIVNIRYKLDNNISHQTEETLREEDLEIIKNFIKNSQ